MAAIDLTTLDATRAFVGVKSTDDNALLASLITAASAWIAGFCSRTFQQNTYNEVRDGHGGNRLPLRESPVVSVTSLAIDEQPILARASVTGSGFVIEPPNLLVLSGYLFTRGVQNVEITYSAGYATTPPEVELFAKMIVAEVYRYKDRTGQKAIVLQGQNIIFKEEDVPAFVRTGLVQGGWKRVVR